jgi:hypothetical protein
MSVCSFVDLAYYFAFVGVTCTLNGGTLKGRTFDSADSQHGLVGIEVHVNAKGQNVSYGLTDNDGSYKLDVDVPIGTVLQMICNGEGYNALPEQVTFDQPQITKDICMYKVGNQQEVYWDAVAAAASKEYGTEIIVPKADILWNDVVDAVGVNPVGKTYLSKAIFKYSPTMVTGLEDFKDYKDADPAKVREFTAVIWSLAGKTGYIPKKEDVLVRFVGQSFPAASIISDVFAAQLRGKDAKDRKMQIEFIKTNWDEKVGSKTDILLDKLPENPPAE